MTALSDDDLTMTAREWLATADFDTVSADLFQSFIATVGYDKAEECKAMMKRVTENLLDSLGSLMMTEASMLKLLRAVSSIAVDNTFPRERHGQ